MDSDPFYIAYQYTITVNLWGGEKGQNILDGPQSLKRWQIKERSNLILDGRISLAQMEKPKLDSLHLKFSEWKRLYV